MRFYLKSTALTTTFFWVFCLLTIFLTTEKGAARPDKCASIRYVRSLAIEENLDGRNLAILEARYCTTNRSRTVRNRSRTVRNPYWILRFDSPLIIHKLQAGTDSIREIPSNTTQLTGVNTQVDYIRNLPSGLKVLNLSGTRVKYIRNLPSGLEVLDLSGTQIEELRDLPSGLEVLDLSGTQIEELRDLPSELKVLDIRNTQVDYLDNLPSSVECIIVKANIQDSRAVKTPRACAVLPLAILLE